MIEPIVYPWIEEDLVHLDQAQSFACITKVALRALSRLNGQAVMVSGPMTTGGKGNLEDNFATYRRAIVYLQKRGLIVFNQLQAEAQFKRLWHIWKACGGKDYCWPILNDFYEPVFRSGMIKGLHFIPDWQSSTGCTRERELAIAIPLEINDLPLDWENLVEITVSER